MLIDYRTDLTKADVNLLPLYKYNGGIVLVRSEDELSAAVERMRRETLLGFDTETRPTFSRGAVNQPALVQIACNDVVFLVQLRFIRDLAPLFAVLSDPGILKVGVAIGDDMRLLQNLYPFGAEGLMDLSEVARARGFKMHGLRGLSAMFLHLRISKIARCSNWNHRELTPQQIVYAATDAWASRAIYLRMQSLGVL